MIEYVLRRENELLHIIIEEKVSGKKSEDDHEHPYIK